MQHPSIIVNALVLVAHGSRFPATANELNNLVENLKTQLSQDPSPSVQVHVAYLELLEPRLDHCLLSLCQQGIKQIDIIPYLLAAGRHLHSDIPLCIDNIKLQFPHIKISLLKHVGASKYMPHLIISLLKENPTELGDTHF